MIMPDTKPIVLSGMQPTGRLHLGNLEGALKNWVRLQGEYEAYFCIVDWHALTSDFDCSQDLQERILQMMLDFLAAGLDPERCTIFIQSQVKEHCELHLLLSMVTPVPWLERVPTYKEKREELGLDSYGFLGYPLLQAADILVYRANYVPVGKDQLPHIELTREIARRFNSFYGEIFPEPEGLLTRFPVIPGIDARKMSKSYANDIAIADSPEVTVKKVLKMYTDPRKIYLGDPGHPEECPVYALHQIYNSGPEEIAAGCRAGSLGCVDCKQMMAQHLNSALRPIREKRAQLEKNLNTVWQTLQQGARKAQITARNTMQVVRKAIGLQ